MKSQNVSYQDRIKYAIIFWGITIVSAVYLIPAMMLVFINPFWFRYSAEQGLQRQIKAISKWRAQQVKPIVDKYRAFQILKTV